MKAGSTGTALVVVVVLAGCTGPVGSEGSATSITGPPATSTVITGGETSPPRPDDRAGGLREARVLDVPDGDSLLVVTGEGDEEQVRLIGINAPELDECLGEESRASLRRISGDTVELSSDSAERDRFGRLLAHVLVGTGYLNRAQVERGLAIATSDDHTLAADLIAAEDEAVEAGVGLWSPSSCGDAPLVPLDVVAVRADPPGPDEQALDLESVTIENPGPDPVGLEGWTLRDESSVNRYRFTDGTLGAGDRLEIVTGCEPGPDRLTWCAGQPVWNNAGDTALLLDGSGRIVDHHRY